MDRSRLAAVAEALADRVGALLLLAPAGFGRIRLVEAAALPGLRRISELALPLALGHRLPLRLAYRALVSSNRSASPELLDRLVGTAGDVVAAAACVTRAVVDAGVCERAFHRRRLAFDGAVTALGVPATGWSRPSTPVVSSAHSRRRRS
jgi:hypothetical protein